MIGIQRRLNRLFDEKSRRCLILPLDHGASDGMIQGLESIPAIIRGLADDDRNPGVQGVILNKGLARAYGGEVPRDVQLVVQLSAGTRHGLPTYNKSVVCSVSEALRLGADAVCLHVNIGNDLEDRMLSDLGAVTDEAHQLGMPVMAVIYALGGQIINEYDPSLVAHCIRLGGELGVDIVSVPYSGDAKSFAHAVETTPCAVLVAGGPSRPNFDSFLTMIEEALATGAAGASIGRNIFQAPDPGERLARVARLVHGAPEDGSAQ